MLSEIDRQQLIRRSLLTIGLLALLVAAGVLIDIVSARRAADPFELAADAPRGALVYAQFSDLPAMLKAWEASELRDRYQAGASFQQLRTRHLALKLVSRWSEFNEAAGFEIDSGVLGGLADNRAAIAIYDIGRLDLALIAPMSEERYRACRFFQARDDFAPAELPDGTTYYLHDVEADRGRQKQQIGFAWVRGRFVLATGEKLLLRAIANLNGQAKKDRMTDDPAFQTLSRAVTPHFATVWVDQARLNDDWYFRHYWLMSRVEELKQIRAGIFDVEMQPGRWIERREFLTTGGRAAEGARFEMISPNVEQRIHAIVPAEIPFIQLRALGRDPGAAPALAEDALFDDAVEPGKKSPGWRWNRHDGGDFEVSAEDGEFYGSSRYSYLSHRYNQFVDDPDDAGERQPDESAAMRSAMERQSRAMIRASLEPAHPVCGAKIARPRVIDGPLFAEFGRAAILVLRQPAALDRPALEAAIGRMAADRTMLANTSARLAWRDRAENGVAWRELAFPALGRGIGYGLRGQLLLFSNSPELLASLMTHQAGNRETLSPAHERTLIRLDQRGEAFDRIFAKLDAPRVKAYWKQRKGDQAGPGDPSREFFSGNLSSLLDAAAPVREIRIQRSFAPGRMREEVSLMLREGR
ncbi:MAG: hypothetical protein ACKVX9_22765 [Blastocatellia bacterium]